VNFHKSKKNKVSLFLLIILTMTSLAIAQDKPKDIKSTIVYGNGIDDEMPIVAGTNLYCAGFVQNGSIDTKVEIVGANEEKDKHIFGQGDLLYINSGAGDGVKVGDMFSVIRPRGKVKTKWTKKNSLGKYVEELGAVEVIRVMPDVSVAKVKTSCGIILFGDLLKPVPDRKSPMFEKRDALDIFASSSGKANGQIFMAREKRELLGREMIVYVDLGREDNVQIGDYMTIYRPLGSGNMFTKVLEESIDNKEEGYQSDRYRGGKFSNQTARKKGENAGGAVVKSEDAKSRRPKNLRRVVGELVVINVLEKTATAMIVRNASEIHTGDRVELQ
jgi:hypothetical protein